jgi:hypothetical protein
VVFLSSLKVHYLTQISHFELKVVVFTGDVGCKKHKKRRKISSGQNKK